MGTSRKLQGEIDRVLKKVQEGVDVFDSIWNKIYDTDNANQREKFMVDLKKEVKKLQRYRDQIKTWIQSSEIKDIKVSVSYMRALMDGRKLIEHEMDRFNYCKKEVKTKAFSKEGLGQHKTDPKEKAKSEIRDWLSNTVSELEFQIDSFETEIEGLSVKKGIAKPPRLTHLESSIARHKAHIMKLELILRLLDNDELSPEQVYDIKDFIDDYVERNQEDFDEFEDVDMLYDPLPLDMVKVLVSVVPPGLLKGVGATGAVLNMKSAVSSPSVPPSRYTFKEMLSATNNFSRENLIMEGALGKVYKGHLPFWNKNLVVQRFDCKYGQADELQTEISTVKSLKHKNIASFFGFCDQNNEKIIIYEAFHGTLSQHISDPTLTWLQRLQICLGVARALNHIHYDVIHCDINSSKIILDKHWEPKVYGFELSTEYPQSWKHRLLFSCYFDTINLTPKYDVYSFGVLLFEVICKRKPMIRNDGVQEELDKTVDPNLRKQMDKETLALFKNLAYNCLNQQLVQRPTMDQIVKGLEEVLELQWKHVNHKRPKVEDVGTSSNSLKMDFLNIPLSKIRLATNNFDDACLVGSGGYGKVYKAKLDILKVDSLSSMGGKRKDELPKVSKIVAIKRIFSREDNQGKQGFLTEIELLTSCKHPNIVSLLGFSREAHEMIIIYEYAFKGSLSDYLGNSNKAFNLTWVQRIQICLDIAHGINYLHTNMDGKPRIIHRDIKSDNILLDENLKAKIADFGLSKFHPMKQQASTIYTKNIAGTEVYMDPEYLTTFKYKKESDVYSFGVVLFEILSGRMAYDSIYIDENNMGLAPIARRRYNEGTLKELIDPKIIEEDEDHIFTLNRGPNSKSFHTFSKIAYRCLAETQAKRPTMEVVIKKLQKALYLQGDTTVLLRFLLRDIVLATKYFAETYCLGLDRNGMVYKAELNHFDNYTSLAREEKKHITLSIKRITASREGGQRKQEFFEEIEIRACKHPNIVHLIGFCDEGHEMILVYEHASGRSLDDYLKSIDDMDNFTWTRRLRLCLEIARGLDHLHTRMVNPQRIMHNDIRSAKILLDKNSEAKITNFLISKLHAPHQQIGMKVYEDPEYETTRKMKRESDIYSFGVVLFEIFCGRVAYDPVYIKENEKGLAPIARKCFKDGTVDRIIDPRLKEETGENFKASLYTFLNIAYECLVEAAKRPTIEMVIKELEMAFNFHQSQYFPCTPFAFSSYIHACMHSMHDHKK